MRIKSNDFRFWKSKDPNPQDEQNEVFNEYYRRVAYANEQFSHYNEGWQTDRGWCIFFWVRQTILIVTLSIMIQSPTKFGNITILIVNLFFLMTRVLEIIV
ncbi:MAG: GWxTD domain-containing protein [Ignavibacteriales bacterium]|nr:GWxTD domain-containing protein [Ignavibacteriales bacterium]